MNAVSPIERYPPTQQRLLRAMLNAPEGITVDQLAQALGVTHNAVRMHLAALQHDGIVERRGQRATGGRPEYLYAISPAGRETFPRRYRQLTETLIQEVDGALGHAALEKVMRRMGRRAAAGLRAAPGDAVSIEQTAQAMTRLGYEAHTRNGEIVALNCVFHELAARFPAVCQFDLAFLETTVGRPVEHRECMVRGGRVCRFAFKGRRHPATRPPGSGEG